MQVLIKVIVAIREQVKALAVFFKDFNVALVSHVWLFLENLVWRLFLVFKHLIVAFLNELTEARHLKDI